MTDLGAQIERSNLSVLYLHHHYYYVYNSTSVVYGDLFTSFSCTKNSSCTEKGETLAKLLIEMGQPSANSSLDRYHSHE
jgi:hypothetical protein